MRALKVTTKREWTDRESVKPGMKRRERKKGAGALEPVRPAAAGAVPLSLGFTQLTGEIFALA